MSKEDKKLQEINKAWFQLTQKEVKHLKKNGEEAETIQIKLRILNLNIEKTAKEELLIMYHSHLARAVKLRIRFRLENNRDKAIASFLSVAPVVNTLVGLFALLITIFVPSFSLPEAVSLGMITLISIAQYLARRFFHDYASSKRYILYEKRSKLFEKEFLRYLNCADPYEGDHTNTYSQFKINFLNIKELSDEEISKVQIARSGEEPEIEEMDQTKTRKEDA